MSATTAQRALIRNLRRELEFDSQYITFLDRRTRIEDKWIGKPLDAYLDSLTEQQASMYIKKLQGMVS